MAPICRPGGTDMALREEINRAIRGLQSRLICLPPQAGGRETSRFGAGNEELSTSAQDPEFPLQVAQSADTCQASTVKYVDSNQNVIVHNFRPLNKSIPIAVLVEDSRVDEFEFRLGGECAADSPPRVGRMDGLFADTCTTSSGRSVSASQSRPDSNRHPLTSSCGFLPGCSARIAVLSKSHRVRSTMPK